jgi:adenylate cyclase
MYVRHLYQRTRTFRRGGFWLVGGLCMLLAVDDGERAAWPVLLGAAFCAVWPWLTDRIRDRGPAAPDGGAFEMALYAMECAVVALVFAWLSLPPLPAFAVVLCLLAGAVALAGWRLLVAAVTALGVGAGAGIILTPGAQLTSSAAVDSISLALILGFTLALAHLSFRQAQRLHGHRQALAQRSAELQRLNDRMRRYLPPSLCARLAQAPEALCRWERRWLTVVFLDLVGFTELAERLQAEPLARILDEYLAAMVEAAERHGGEVSKLLGDGVLVVFDTAGDGDRRRCVSAALAFCSAMPEQLAVLAARWRERGEPIALKTRAGIASGYCTLGDRGGAGRLDFTLVGSPVNLASRLQSRAGVGGVLLDTASAALAEGAWGLQPGRRQQIKGFGAIMVYRMAGADARPAVGAAAPENHSAS